MAEELQSLLDKIHRDGLAKAAAERDAMLQTARTEAEAIRAAARRDAEQSAADAAAAAAALEKRAENAIRQAARDILLELKSELQRRLEAIVKNRLDDALTPEFMAEIVAAMVKTVAADPAGAAGNELGVMVAPAQLDELIRRLAASVGADFASQAKVFPNASIGRGLKISLKDNQVFYDFSDAALSDMICAFAGSKVGAIIAAGTSTDSQA